MLGSFHEAGDLVQETMLRAWRTRDRYGPARAPVRTWLYRIAASACLSALEGRARRPLPSGPGAPGDDPGAPLAQASGIPWLQPFPDARSDIGMRAGMRLALVAAMQVLPRRQRAVRLLADAAVLEMPPVPLWYRGRRDYGLFMRRVFEMRGTGWATRQLTASGQPALAAYPPVPAGGHRLHTLQVFTVAGGQVARSIVFADPAVFGAFQLPGRVSPGELRRER
jgi:hypothetical protein